jgi:hypothetical protein
MHSCEATEGIINHDDIKIISYDDLVNLDELEAAAAAERAPQIFTAEAAIQVALQQAPWLQEQRRQQRQQERKAVPLWKGQRRPKPARGG